MALSREQIRERIDALECMSDLAQAVGDVSDVEWEENESQELNVTIQTRSDKKDVAFVHGVPPSVLLAGLRAMECELAKLADVRETVEMP